MRHAQDGILAASSIRGNRRGVWLHVLDSKGTYCFNQVLLRQRAVQELLVLVGVAFDIEKFQSGAGAVELCSIMLNRFLVVPTISCPVCYVEDDVLLALSQITPMTLIESVARDLLPFSD